MFAGRVLVDWCHLTLAMGCCNTPAAIVVFQRPVNILTFYVLAVCRSGTTSQAAGGGLVLDWSANRTPHQHPIFRACLSPLNQKNDNLPKKPDYQSGNLVKKTVDYQCVAALCVFSGRK